MFLNYLKHVRASGKRYFTLQQALNDLKISRYSILSAIYRMKKKGDIISPAKGLYVIIPPEYQEQGCLPAEEIVPIITKYLDVNYYVCLLTAAMYHGSGHQRPASFQIMTDKRIKRNLRFGKVHIDCIYKQTIENLPTQNFLVTTGYLRVASPELTAMDLFLYSNKSGGLNHIATVLSELIESINPDELIKLVGHSNEIFWIQRMGYILEKIEPMDTFSNQKIIDRIAEILLLKKIKYVPLAPEISSVGYPRFKKWKIIENTTIESDV
jgi:predicted transcriptional regulator of viral defense system